MTSLTYQTHARVKVEMYICVFRGDRRAGGDSRPGQTNGSGGEDRRHQRCGAGLHSAGAGGRSAGEEKVKLKSQTSSVTIIS